MSSTRRFARLVTAFAGAALQVAILGTTDTVAQDAGVRLRRHG